eukprot:SAG22_NODE_882_length_6687_cov_5.782332_2_plen_362_part_00
MASMSTFLLLLTLGLTCAPGATSTLNKASPPFDATGKMSSSESSDRTSRSHWRPCQPSVSGRTLVATRSEEVHTVVSGLLPGDRLWIGLAASAQLAWEWNDHNYSCTDDPNFCDADGNTRCNPCLGYTPVQCEQSSAAQAACCTTCGEPVAFAGWGESGAAEALADQCVVLDTTNEPWIAATIRSIHPVRGLDAAERGDGHAACQQARPAGADLQNFMNTRDNGSIKACANLVAGSQRMRNDPNLIGRFTALPGNPPPVLLYLQEMLGTGKLTAIESVELGRQVIAKNKLDTLQQWIEQDKLECSEELSNLVKPLEAFIGMSMIQEATAFALNAFKGESTEEKGPLQVSERECSCVGQPLL